ncbi:MAG: tripartite tricarboxylate transporter substrate binding protein [Peptostreptococcaceae bacterium]|nr:tripartite tricarboxylate transporter substrate binding protein [Peptostreptococcaceae bacterium]
MKFKKITSLVSTLLILVLAFSGCSTKPEAAPEKDAPQDVAKGEYPVRPVNYILPFDPGGESDITARMQQKPLEEILGKSVVVQYKPGGGGALGWQELVSDTKPDGYNIMGSNLPHIILQPLVRDDAGYETDQLVPIYYFQATSNILAVAKDSPINSVDEFVAYAKANPGAVTLAGSGSYSANHLGVLVFNKIAGIETTYIPETGSGGAIPQLLGGHVMGLMTYTTMGINHSEDLKILAVASEERVEALPDTPTFKELGYDYVEGAYRGISGPPGLSDEIVNTLAAAFKEINAQPEYLKKMKDMGFEILDYGPAESKKLVSERKVYYEKLLKELGLIK